MKPIAKGIVPLNLEHLALALGVFPHELAARLEDGRLAAPLARLAVARRALGGELLPMQEVADIIDVAGRKWQVRSLTLNGVSFVPSSMRGVGREFDYEAWRLHCGELFGFLVTYPNVNKDLWQWWAFQADQITQPGISWSEFPEFPYDSTH